MKRGPSSKQLIGYGQQFTIIDMWFNCSDPPYPVYRVDLINPNEAPRGACIYEKKTKYRLALDWGHGFLKAYTEHEHISESFNLSTATCSPKSFHIYFK